MSVGGSVHISWVDRCAHELAEVAQLLDDVHQAPMRQFNPPVEGKLDPPNTIRGENTKYWVGGDHRENPRRGIDVERMPLPQVQKPRDGIDIAAGDHHPRNRRRS